MGKLPIDLSSVTTVGLDLAKHVFFIHAVDVQGHVVIAKEVRRRDLLSFFAALPACLVGVEACSSAHHWGRRRTALLVFARWVLVMTHFERGFYADPDADHDTGWWDLVERFQLLTRPDGRHAPDWAAKLHVALAPVYYQNYLLGELVASQLQATLIERFGGVIGRPEVGAFLSRQVFGPGWSVRWDQLVETATGAPLRVDAFAAELAALAASVGAAAR